MFCARVTFAQRPRPRAGHRSRQRRMAAARRDRPSRETACARRTSAGSVGVPSPARGARVRVWIVNEW